MPKRLRIRWSRVSPLTTSSRWIRARLSSFQPQRSPATATVCSFVSISPTHRR
ncbi:hypothetical protein RHECNPAF_4460015 [Rhizobium etli CNPAF512]|nr:hypothetical protein RHECNPAF_4460015 [Rhizobium etli CNPAF512]